MSQSWWPQMPWSILQSIWLRHLGQQQLMNWPWQTANGLTSRQGFLDGSGYPSGLKSGEIRLETRILGVADVVEAMASHRPYRPACGIDNALEEISKNGSTLYDPEVVDACVSLFAEKGFVFG